MPQNCNVLSEPRLPAPLAAHEIEELKLLHTGQSSMVAVPDFIVPDANEAVMKYDTCKSFNVVHRRSSKSKEMRDCLVACNLDFPARRQEATRVYGEIRYFLKLRVKNVDPRLSACIAYVDWFVQKEGDGVHVSRTHPAEATVHCRAVPISAIVCKIALFPVSAAGQRCSVLELL